MSRGAESEDGLIVANLKELAKETRAESLASKDDVLQRASAILTRFASADGQELREWMVRFRDRQAVRRKWEAPEQHEDETEDQFLQRMGALAARAPPTDEDGDIRDEEGRPAVIEVAGLLDSLAFWVARGRMPQEWQRPKADLPDSDLLERVAAKSRELAKLIGRREGPDWPIAIRLFERKARPAYQQDVYARLKQQSMAGLLENLALEAERLSRMSEHDLDVQFTPRPEDARAEDRRRARAVREWFDQRCGSPPASAALIADVVNMSRLSPLGPENEEVTPAQIQKWATSRFRTSRMKR